MIRSPLTSISLSAKDVDFHLQQIDIYHGLLKQGFRKKDVLRYFEERREDERKPSAGVKAEYDFAQMVTTVELAGRRITSPILVDAPSSPDRTKLITTSKDKGSQEHITTTNATNRRSPSQSVMHITCPISGYSDEQYLNHNQTNIPPSPTVPMNNAASTRRPSTQSNQNETAISGHVPRRSSLLRYTKTVSSDEVDPKPEVPAMPRNRITYRHRTETQSYEESEDYSHSDEQLDEALNHLVIDDSLDIFDTKYSISRPKQFSFKANAPEFMPLNLPPPFSTFQRTSSSQLSLPSVTKTEVLVSTDQRHTSSPLSDSSPGIDYPSSPPIAPGSSSSWISSPRVAPILPSASVTPQPIHQVVHAETEPRGPSYQPLDGTSFAVYDDNISADLQPQTPADLLRRSVMTEYSAAYTAPPGGIRTSVLSPRDRHQTGHDVGEQSPTVRAMSVRSRRTREYIRSTQVESQRLTRTRRRPDQQTSTNQTQFFYNNVNARMSEVPMWRDDLDADRVGEENFESQESPSRSSNNGMRSVSGNLQQLDM